MKKIAFILAVSLMLPLVGITVSHSAAAYSDLAVGDPLGGKAPSKRHAGKKKTAAEAEAKARPVGVVAAVRIGIVVIGPVQPNQAAMPMTNGVPGAMRP